jgi:hypothetical protein
MLAVVIFSVLATSATGTADPVDTFGRPLGLQLLDARLEQLESVLGQYQPEGDDPFVCYVAPRRDVFLRFLLDGRLGSERRISGFTMRELSGAMAAPCSLLESAVEERVDLSVGGLRLGMSRLAVEDLLGPGVESDDGRLFRQFTNPDRDIVISARFRDERLTELNVLAGWRRRPTMR